MTDNFQFGLRNKLVALDAFLRVEQAYKEDLKARVGKLKVADDTFATEYITKKIDELVEEGKVHGRQAAKEFLEQIKALGELLARRKAEPLDLNNPALVTALDVVRSAGKSLPGAELVKIIEQFRGDPAALAVLKGAFVAADVPFGKTVIEEDCEFLDLTWELFADIAHQCFYTRSASLDAAASSIDRYTRRAGVPFPVDGVIDPTALERNLRAGVGLPEKDS